MSLDLNNYFVERRNQFHKSVYQKLFRSNPFRSLVPMSAFDLTEGRTPTVRTVTHELPTTYPTDLTEVQVSTGTGDPYCSPSATTIKRGEIQRTFKLYQKAFRTDTVCLSDLKRAQDAADTVGRFERALNEYLSVWWGDWYRLQNIAMVDNKVATNTSGAITVANSQTGDHTGLAALPTDKLQWDHLKQIYWDIIQNGLADEYAVGRDSKGRPVFPLYAGSGTISRLWTDTTIVKDTVKYFEPAKNLQVLGYDGAVNGFLPVVDLFPIRYGKITTGITGVSDLTLTNAIYPTTNANATVGRKYTRNANYAISTKGGLAEYEVASVIPRDVYEAKFEAVDPTTFSGETFKAVPSYVGDFQWINNATFEGDNDRGNLGYYLADIRVGAKPIFPEFGYSILSKASDV